MERRRVERRYLDRARRRMTSLRCPLSSRILWGIQSRSVILRDDDSYDDSGSYDDSDSYDGDDDEDDGDEDT